MQEWQELSGEGGAFKLTVARWLTPIAIRSDWMSVQRTLAVFLFTAVTGML